MTADLGLADKVVVLHRALEQADIAHAFGGALALAYYAEPRATIDIDVNLFVEPAAYGGVLAIVGPLGVTRAPPAAEVERDGQCRLWWGRNPLDLFFAYDDVHRAMRDGRRVVPFGDDDIPIIAPEHLAVAKIVFNRTKDWLDIEQMLIAVPGLDLGEISRWLDHIVGLDDERALRFDALCRRVLDA